MNEIACAVRTPMTHEEHVASDAATRSGNEPDGYVLEVVGETWREVESSWRGSRAETASEAAPDMFIRSSHEK